LLVQFLHKRKPSLISFDFSNTSRSNLELQSTHRKYSKLDSCITDKSIHVGKKLI